MGEKECKHGECDSKKKNKGGGDAKKVEAPTVTVVFKVDMHCEGCADKIIACARKIDGVETVKAEVEAKKLTVVGKVDPAKVREKLQKKTKKKIELVSPLPKKEKGGDGGGDKKTENKKPEEKKPKEPPVTTAVLKLPLHCEGCVERIQKVLSKTPGVQTRSIDRQKDLVTVTGTMDAKALAENLRRRLKKPVEIVPPKKEKDGGGAAKEGGGDGGKKQAAASKGEDEVRTEFYGHGYAVGYPYEYGPGYVMPGYGYHAPQWLSDENPNACSVM